MYVFGKVMSNPETFEAFTKKREERQKHHSEALSLLIFVSYGA